MSTSGVVARGSRAYGALVGLVVCLQGLAGELERAGWALQPAMVTANLLRGCIAGLVGGWLFARGMRWVGF